MKVDQGKDLCCPIKLKGNDAFGVFEANGFIVEKHRGTFLWFMKVYDDRQKAGQTNGF